MARMALPQQLQFSKQVILKESGEIVHIGPIFASWTESGDIPENSKLERVVELLSSAWVCPHNRIDYFTRFTHANSDLSFVAIHNTKLVGIICGTRGDDDGFCVWLCNYFVSPEYRWQGVGRALWDTLMDAIAARPEAVGRSQPVRLGLMTTRHSMMRSFYEKFGFTRVCEPPGGNKFTSVTPWDAIVWLGTINESKLKHALHDQHTSAKLEVHQVDTLSDAMHELLEKIVGLRRRKLLSVWEPGAHLLECWQNGVPTGFALALEFERVFWLAWAVGIEIHISLRLLLEQLCAAYQRSPRKPVSLMTLRGPGEAAGIASLLERLGLRQEENGLIFYKAVGISGGSAPTSRTVAGKSTQSTSSTSSSAKSKASDQNGDYHCDYAFWDSEPPPAGLLVVPQGDFPPI